MESYQDLSPNSGDTAVALLKQISQQIAAAANGSQANTFLPEEIFQPTSSTLRVNALWFMSLGLALSCALAATLVQQWARGYLKAIERRPAPHKKGEYDFSLVFRSSSQCHFFVSSYSRISVRGRRKLQNDGRG